VEYDFLEIGVYLIFMAISGLIAVKLQFSIVPILIAIGLLLPPNGVAVQSPGEPSLFIIHFFGEIGVLFLLLSMGLEFSIKKLINSAGTVIKNGVIYLIINAGLTLIFTLCLGWSAHEILIVVGIMNVSSSAIVAKTLVDLKRTANRETELILGQMLFEDIFVAIYLSIISAIVFSRDAHISEVLISVGAAFLFIAAFIGISLKSGEFLEKILDISSDEVLLLVIVAILITLAGVTEKLQVAEAVGALILGMVLAETSHHERILRLIVPFRDFFGAAFFFSFGLNIVPSELSGAIGVALVAVLITVAGNFAFGVIMGKTAGISRRGAVNVGLTITSRGEFSIILANLGVAAGLSATLKSFSILYVFLLAVLGPLLSKESGRIYKILAGVLGWKDAGRKKPPALKEPET
jgi:CPA2 family monovalent cation:H+ antiporter-2